MRRRRGRVALVTALAIMGLAAPALAVTAPMGNAPVPRVQVDEYFDNTFVDMNNPAPFDGYFTEIDYYAGASGSVRFVIVDSAHTVTWISEMVTIPGPGPGTFTSAAPVGVSRGSNLGFYTVGHGPIYWEYHNLGHTVDWTIFSTGVPAVGETLVYEGTAPDYEFKRYYSLQTEITASSPQICKNGGWQNFGHRNQGQCIASIVANKNSGH